MLERQHGSNRHRRGEYEGKLHRVVAQVPATTVTPDRDQEAGDDGRGQDAQPHVLVGYRSRTVEQGGIDHDRGDERRRRDDRCQHCDQWMASDPAVQSTIPLATGDQQTHREPCERRVRQSSDPHVAP